MTLSAAVLVGLAGLSMAAEPVAIAGRALIQSRCASGGEPDYYFFAGGVVISYCAHHCSHATEVGLGSWRVEGEVVEVSIERLWFGEGEGDPDPEDGANGPTRYSSYVGRETAASQRARFPLSTFSEESCVLVEKHNGKADPREFLRAFSGRYPQTSTRPLSRADLAGKSREELRLMRNEIYARYGLIFVSPELKAHFASEKRYSPKLTNVDAFLSPLEQDNVAHIAAEEKLARPKR